MNCTTFQYKFQKCYSKFSKNLILTTHATLPLSEELPCNFPIFQSWTSYSSPPTPTPKTTTTSLLPSITHPPPPTTFFVQLHRPSLFSPFHVKCSVFCKRRHFNSSYTREINLRVGVVLITFLTFSFV